MERLTEQEAINELVDYVGDVFKTTISFDTVTMARKALEKQIPKKMGFVPKKFPSDYKCPNGCNLYDEYQIKYCPNCGQKLDW